MQNGITSHHIRAWASNWKRTENIGENEWKEYDFHDEHRLMLYNVHFSNKIAVATACGEYVWIESVCEIFASFEINMLHTYYYVHRATMIIAIWLASVTQTYGILTISGHRWHIHTSLFLSYESAWCLTCYRHGAVQIGSDGVCILRFARMRKKERDEWSIQTAWTI